MELCEYRPNRQVVAELGRCVRRANCALGGHNFPFNIEMIFVWELFSVAVNENTDSTSHLSVQHRPNRPKSMLIYVRKYLIVTGGAF
jgi:hypothetical protein